MTTNSPIRRTHRGNKSVSRQALRLLLPLRQGPSQVRLRHLLRDQSPTTDPVDSAVVEQQLRTGVEVDIAYSWRAGVWKATDGFGNVWQSPKRNRLLMTLLEHLSQLPAQD